MPGGTFIKGPGDKFLESTNIDCGGNNVGYISGKGDAFLELDDGSFAVVDFKTSALTQEGALSYSSQLHAYKYALENNKVIEGDPNKIKTVIDRWKFTRKTSSMNPNWYLTEIKNS